MPVHEPHQYWLDNDFFPIYQGPVYPILSQYKDVLSSCRDFHNKDEMVVRQSYLYNGNSCTGRTTGAPGHYLNHASIRQVMADCSWA